MADSPLALRPEELRALIRAVLAGNGNTLEHDDLVRQVGRVEGEILAARVWIAALGLALRGEMTFAVRPDGEVILGARAAHGTEDER